MIINRGRGETFLDCPRKYHYTYNPQPGAPNGLVKQRVAPPLRIGIAAHRWLEEWYGDLEKSETSREVAAFEAMEKSLMSSQQPVALPGEEEAERSMMEETRALMVAYKERWGVAEPFTVLQPEVDGCVSLGGTSHLLRFRTDAVINYLNRLWLMENKTSAILGPMFLRKFQFNHQLTLYVYGVGKILNTLISGVFLNVLRKRNPNYKNSSFEFHRETIVVTENHIRGTLATFVNICNDIESRDAATDLDWPQDTNRCFDFGGCPFYEVCALGVKAEANELYAPRLPDYVDEHEPTTFSPPK